MYLRGDFMDKQMDKHFKGKEFYETQMNDLRNEYKSWKKKMKIEGQPFFMIYKTFQNEHLADISGGALKLYMYLGFQSNNFTGESWHSVETIADYFGNDPRTVQKWFKELEDRHLIQRVQRGYKWISNTFLLPYGKESDALEEE